MQTMHARPASNVARPQRSMHAYPKLSSEIVRPVFQRDIATKNELARSLKRGTTRSDVSMQRPALSCTSQSSYLAAKLTQAEHHLNSSYNINSRFTDGPLDSANARARKHFRDFDIDQSQPKQKRIRLKTQRRREQCRANQARYRLKQIDHAKWVKESVLKLRADIPVLELQRTALRHGGQQDVWNAVVKYLRIFRFGVLVTLPPADIEEANIADNSIENEETKQQLAFLRSTMTEDVNLGERTGVEALMDQWRQYSTSFQNLCLELIRMERTTDRFVSVTATLNMTVSEATLKTVFQHLEDRPLRSKLLGQHLQVPYSICFEWDTATCRLSRAEALGDAVDARVRESGGCGIGVEARSNYM